MYYKHPLLMPGPAEGGNGGNNPPPLESGADGDMASKMVAEMEALSSGQPAAPAGTPPPAAPAAKTPEPPAKAPEPGKAPQQPAAKAPAPAPAPKPAAPAAKAAPVAQPKPGEVDDSKLDWKTAPKQFQAAHEKLVQVHRQETQRLTSELQTTQTKMRELEGKKFLSPEQEQKYAKLEQDQDALRAELYARDYREAPEFKAKYDAKSKALFKRLEINLKSLTVDDGNGGTRQATAGDFQKVDALAGNPIEQRRTAKALFGEDADVILADARELQNIRNAADEEIEMKRSGFKADREKQQQQFQQESQQSLQAFKEYDGLIETKFPQYFAPIEGNDDYNKAREEGLKYVDTTSAALGSKTPQERAFQTALMRRWAAAFPATQVLLKQSNEKIAELQAEIARLRGTDPGELGEGGSGGGGGGESDGGTDALASEIDKMVKGNA